MKNFLTSIVIIILVLFAMPVWSASVWDGTADIWTKGTGTESDPYQIETAQHLAFIAEMVNGGVTSYAGNYFILTDDIDLNNLEWVPIGNSANIFEASFDGQNHVISNVKVSISVNEGYNGLFGYSTGNFSNLDVIGNISSGQYKGGVVAYWSGDSIVNCSFAGSITDSFLHIFTYSGGIIGYCSSTGNVSNCYNSGAVSSSSYSPYPEDKSYSGGIVGYNSSTCSISHCNNSGSISAFAYYCYSGGIVGYESGSGRVSYCSNRGAVSSTSTSSYSETSCSGGIVGYGSGDVNVSNCSNRGSISSSSMAGGIIGYRLTNSTTVNYCYNSGKVDAAHRSYGIAYDGIVKNSYNVGTLQHSSSFGVNYSGCTNSFYLESCGTNISGCGTSKTAESMRSTSFPIILNGSGETVFVKDVDNINDGYPVLAWQLDNNPAIVVSCNNTQGTVFGTGSYPKGTNATISATPNSGYVFTRWNDGDTSNPRTIKVTENAQYVALFEQAVINVKVGQDCSITQE